MARPPALGLGTLALAALAALAACGRGGGGGGGGGASVAGDGAFDLAGEGSATDTTGTAYCVRTDTRSGDVVRVDLNSLPVSNGPTGTASGPAGRYKTVCSAVNMAERSDFYCVRLNTESGELLMINLTKVGEIPRK